MEEIKRIVKRWNVTTQIDFMLFIVSTYPDWHCSQWLIFTAKIQNLDSNGNHNRKHADANEKHEINTYNISRKQTCIICFNHFICYAQNIHRESKKTRPQTLGHNFTNYYPIFKFFSLATRW